MEKRQYGEITTFDTRAESNEKVDRNKRYAQIIVCLKKANDGMTAKEIAVMMYLNNLIPSAERNFTAPRLNELSKKGVVEPIGKKKCKYTGRMVTVYGLVG